MKTKDGSLDEEIIRNLNVMIEGLGYPALAAARQPTEQMIDSASKVAPYLNRDAVEAIVGAALDQNERGL